MFSICRKELNKFFSTLTGYIAIVLFLLVCGIYLFILPESNLIDNNYATLDGFFDLAPWVLLFLVPAITMNTFSEEYKTGSFELLKTKPLTSWQIVSGKYASILIVMLFVLVPTLIYVVTIKILSASGNIDGGGIAGSYTGLFMLSAVFAAISLCCSSFTSNSIVAFLISGFVCLTLYFGFNALSKLPFIAGNADYYTEMAGIDFHYRSISRGVLDTRDILYFFSIIFISLFITVKNISRR